MPVKYRELSDGQRAVWHTESPETTVLVMRIHPDAEQKYTNRE